MKNKQKCMISQGYDFTSSAVVCYYDVTTNEEEKLRVTNRDILRQIKLTGKKQKKTLENISEGIGRKKNYLSTTISKKKKLVSLEVLLDVADYLGCELMDLLSTEITIDEEKEEKDDNENA
jgi:hypothetical protein